MKETIDHTIKLCIDAINHSGDGQDLEVLQYIRDYAPQSDQGSGLGIGAEGYRGYRSSYEDLLKRLMHRKRLNDNLDWEKALMLLYYIANYNESDMLLSAKNISDDIIFNHILEHIISNLVAKKDVENGLKFIPNFRTTTIFREENNQDNGYLIILRYYAAQGDPINFFSHFKLAEPSKNKSELAELKAFLVESFAEKHTIEEAINLCKHKNLGKKFLINALNSFAKTGKYHELIDIFAKYPELRQLENETELSVLSTCYFVAKKNEFLIADDFDVLFERALNLDRKIKSGVASLQDAVLFNLGSAEYENKERREKCRKAIKNNSIKKEFDGRFD